MKKWSKEWLKKQKSLMDEAVVLMMRSEAILEESGINVKKVDKHVEEYMNDDFRTILDWQKGEKEIHDAQRLWKHLQNTREKLIRMELDFEDLRKRTNEFYDREIMKGNHKISERLPDLDEDDDDYGEWWKRCDE
jgi:hypothetical protein